MPTRMTAIATPPERAPNPERGEHHFQTALKSHLAGDFDAAAKSYERAIHAAPAHGEAANNFATLLLGRGDMERAESMLRAVCAQHPAYASPHYNLGLYLVNVRRPAEATPFLERAIALEPGHPDWLNTLGNVHNHALRYEQALALYERAVQIAPDFADGWNNQGVVLRGLLRREEAVAAFQRAIALSPGFTGALSNLGYVYKELRRFPEAVQTFEMALALAPTDPVVLGSYSVVFLEQGDLEQARAIATRAVDANPDSPAALNALANCFAELGRVDEAVALYDRVLAIEPDEPNSSYNRALIHLLHEEFAAGWPLFEARLELQVMGCDLRHIPGALWRGEPLHDRTILIHTEQGIGDSLQFIRYAAELKARGARRVIVEALPHLAEILMNARSVDRVIVRGAPLPAFDYRVYLMSIPGILDTTRATIPTTIPYLRATASRATATLRRGTGKLRVGLVWSGNVLQQRNALRSSPFAALAPLLEVPGVEFYSLQKGGPEAELQHATGQVIDLGPALVELNDTAAVIDELDLVITVCTSMAHLAGGLGVPTWVALASMADWRWHDDEERSAWYPNARLFRQTSAGDWGELFERMADALAELTRTTTPRAAAEVQANPATDAEVASDAGSPAASGIITLSSADRDADGDALFTLGVSLAALADPRHFAEFEAELTGAGWEREARAFLAEALPSGALLLDLAPGLGCMPLGVAARRRGDVAVICVSDDESTQARIGAAAEVAQLHGQIINMPLVPSPDVLRALAPVSVWLHLGEGVQTDAVSALLAASPPITIGAVVWPTSDRESGERVAWLTAAGYTVVGLAMRDEDVEVIDLDGAPVAVALSSDTARSVTVAAQATTPRRRMEAVVLDWPVGAASGWGTYGAHLAAELQAAGGASPILLGGVDERTLDPSLREALREPMATMRTIHEALRDDASSRLDVNGVLLQALGNGLHGADVGARVDASRRVGAVFFEDTAVDDPMRRRAAAFDLIVAGSSWNTSVLEAAGITHVVTALQGVDLEQWRPRPRRVTTQRFVIFTGGKLEYRKGQDLVVAAFRRFRERHPDALLMTAWHNHWPQTICDLELAGHVRGIPRVDEGRLGITAWLAANGIAAADVRDLGVRAHSEMPALVAGADVALFPNRCEGGTNLVAMECMAAGIPTIVSANSGHLDLVATDGCMALGAQRAVPQPTQLFRGVAGWGESDVDEMVDALERVYTDSAMARALGARGATAMQDWSWKLQTQRLVTLLDSLFI